MSQIVFLVLSWTNQQLIGKSFTIQFQNNSINKWPSMQLNIMLIIIQQIVILIQSLMIAYILVIVYKQLLLYMNAYPNSPSRLPINMIQNPYTYSINAQHSNSMQPYNFHDISMGNSPRRSRAYDTPIQQPNLTQNLNLADNQSFARNFKTRLYGADPNEQAVKQQKLQRYRQQLLMQAEENKRRKQQQKAKADAEDEKLERQFYQNIKIEAQKKAVKKEQPAYFMMRTVKGDKKRLNKSANLTNSRELQLQENNYVSAQKKNNVAVQFSPKDNLKRTLYENAIMKRGGYHNKSSLDPVIPNPEDNQPKQSPKVQKSESPKQQRVIKKVEEGIQQQLKYEQQRINQILLFQQHMLKKLDYFKKDVIHASKSLQLQDQLDKIKVQLRAKPLNMMKIHSLNPRQGIQDMMMENSSFYRLPIINPHKHKVYEGSRQIKKRKDKQMGVRQLKSEEVKQQQQQKQLIKLEDRRIEEQVYNDKNIVLSGRNSDFAIQADEE